jgi:hypothetical protein
MISNSIIKSGAPTPNAEFIVDINPNTRNTDFIYYECVSYNSSMTAYTPAKYSNSRLQPIVPKLSDYKFAVVRLESNVQDVPLFFNTDLDLTFSLIYPPDNIVITSTLFNGQDIPIFNYSQVIDEFNADLASAWTALIAAYQVIHGAGSWVSNGKPQNVPGVTFNPSTDFFTFYMDAVSYYDFPLSGNANQVLLALSPTFSFLFAGNYTLPISQVYPALSATNDDVLIFNPGFANTNEESFSTGGAGFTGPYITNISQYSSDANWYQIQQILLISDSLSCRKEYVGNSNTSSSGSQVRGVIVDFNIRVDNTNAFNPTTRFVYIPLADYRYVDLFGDTPLYTLDFGLYYSTKTQSIRPVMIPPQQSFNVKILFTKRIV